MHTPHCPHCSSVRVQRRGSRRGAIKYWCTSCLRWFQINRAHTAWSPQQLALLHLDGLSFRTLADQSGLSVGAVWRKVHDYLVDLPHCADITRNYCQRFSGILLVDGKFVKIKGYERKLPVVYGVDYTTHDFPSYRLGRNEGFGTCYKFFASLKLANYPLQALVCDDNQSIRDACLKVYPAATVQLCQNHYKQNIRVAVDVSHQVRYQPFIKNIEILFAHKRSEDDINKRAKDILRAWNDDPLVVEIMVDMYRNRHLLFGWKQGNKGIPTTTNLIECFNSHLQGRLETIKGFESFGHANTWLNAHFIRRRTKKLQDCAGKFSKLNGSTPLQNSVKRGIDVPSFFK